MRPGSVDGDLGGEREGHPVVDLAELLDLAVVTGLLMHELVAGKAEDDQALVAVLLVERLQPVVLRGEPAPAGRVDDQDGFAREVAQLHLLAVIVGEREVVERLRISHDPIVHRC